MPTRSTPRQVPRIYEFIKSQQKLHNIGSAMRIFEPRSAVQIVAASSGGLLYPRLWVRRLHALILN
jgi:hypothetical protein